MIAIQNQLDQRSAWIVQRSFERGRHARQRPRWIREQHHAIGLAQAQTGPLRRIAVGFVKNYVVVFFNRVEPFDRA